MSMRSRNRKEAVKSLAGAGMKFGSPRPWAVAGAEVIGPLLLLLAALWFWFHGLWRGMDLPFWAGTFDIYLDGPDAGAWASSAWAVFEGRFSDVDPNRMPTWLLLCAGAMHLTDGDVALAGHLVNRAAFLGLPLVVYGIGRLGGNRGVGLAAGLLTIFCPILGQASRRYGADPAVAFMLCSSVLAALSVRRHFLLGLLAGGIAAFASIAHFTTLAYPLCAALGVLIHGGRAWRRWAALGCFVVALLGTLSLVGVFFDLPGREDLTRVFSAGLASTPNTGLIDDRANEAHVLATVRRGLQESLGSSLDKAVYNLITSFRPLRVPWTLALVAPWIGVLGLFLRPAPQLGGPGVLARLRCLLGHADLGTGILLLSCLAPLPILAAVNAPTRYADNLAPFGIILFTRGLFAIPGLVALVAGRYRPSLGTWAQGIGAAAILGILVWGSVERVDWRRGPPGVPSREMVEVRSLGRSLKAHFPTSTSAVCVVREASAYAGMDYCPGSPCPMFWDERSFRECLSVVAEECRGDGPIPWVVVEGAPSDALPAPRRDMDAWMLERWPVVEVFEGTSFKATMLSVAREELEKESIPRRPPGPPTKP
jgi:hypothetical protein